MIKHLVLWKLKESAEGKTRQENALELKAALEGLKGKVREIQALEVGLNFNPADTASDLSLYSEFKIGYPGNHRQDRRGALQSLDLRLFVYREDRRVRRRREVQADHVADLVDRQRVGRDLEGLGAPGLQAERPPGRCTLAGEIPTWRASSRLDQWVAPSGTSSRVRTTTSSTWASVIVRGTPGRGSSPSPSSRRATNRARHLVTVTRLTRSRAETAVLLRPSAQASTIRARSASPCAVFRRFAQFSNVRRSASDSTSGSSLLSPMPPADRGPKLSSPPSRVLRRNTTHVVPRELKTGTLAPDGLLGIHLNFLPAFPTDVLAAVFGGSLPHAGLFKRVAVAVLAAHAEKKQPTALDALVALWKRGYIVEMPEHPQTIGYALTDTPVGLAAWMLDHDADSYQKISRAFLDGRPAGGLTRDRIVDNITLYWLTGTATSSARLYWETGRTAVAAAAAGQKPPELSLPVAFTVFPGEIFQAPRSWAEKVYPKLTYFNEARKGGHFAAWEQPDLFAAEMRASFRSLR